MTNTTNDNAPALLTSTGFELAQRMATALSKSTLVPKEFQNNIPNCLIALEMANRMSASPMMVMQNLYIVHGKPAWSSQFIIAAINSTGKFSPLRFAITGEGDKRECVAWAIESGSKERLESPAISIAMAKAEGWHSRNGSKWQTMPELMLRYRAATFFGRLYAPEVLMGMREESEIIDIDAQVTAPKIERPVIGDPSLSVKETRKRISKAKDKESVKPTTNAFEIAKRLASAGYDAKDLIQVAVKEKWIEQPFDDTSLAEVPEDKCAALLDMWPTVAEKIDAADQPQGKPFSQTKDALFA